MAAAAIGNHNQRFFVQKCLEMKGMSTTKAVIDFVVQTGRFPREFNCNCGENVMDDDREHFANCKKTYVTSPTVAEAINMAFRASDAKPGQFFYARLIQQLPANLRNEFSIRFN